MHAVCRWTLVTGCAIWLGHPAVPPALAQGVKELTTLRGHSQPVINLRFLPDGKALSTASWQKVIRWDLSTAKQLAVFKPDADAMTHVAFTVDGSRFACGLFSPKNDKVYRRILIADSATGKDQISLEGQRPRLVEALAFTSDGNTLASAANGEVKLWDLAGGKERALLQYPGWGPGHFTVASLTFTTDGEALIAAGSVYGKKSGKRVAAGRIRVWDVAAGKVRTDIEVPEKGLSALALSSDGTVLATASPDGTVKLWDMRTGKERNALKGHTGVVWSGAFTSDGRLLALGNKDGTVRLWEVATGEQLAVLRGHEEPVVCVAFGKGDRLLASGGFDQTVKLWDVAELTVPRQDK